MQFFSSPAVFNILPTIGIKKLYILIQCPPSLPRCSVAKSYPSLQPYKPQHTPLTVVKTVICSSLSYSAFHPFPPHLKILVTELL